MLYYHHMEFPLWIILVPFSFVVACSAIFLFINVFHLHRYGIVGRGARGMIWLYIGSYLIILVIGVGMLSTVKWNTKVPIKELIPFSIGNSSTFYGL